MSQRHIDPTKASGQPVTLRVYAGNALVAPGTLYKSIIATSDTTTQEVIAEALKRYDDGSSVHEFELHFVKVNPKTGKPVRKGSLSNLFAPGGSTNPFVIADEMHPVLVAEWFKGESRRFELVRKSKKKLSRAGSLASAGYGSPRASEGSITGIKPEDLHASSTELEADSFLSDLHDSASHSSGSVASFPASPARGSFPASPSRTSVSRLSDRAKKRVQTEL